MRKAPTIGERIDAMLFRFVCHCGLCGMRLQPGDKIIWEHDGVLVANGAGNRPDEITPVHKACADRKTFGNKATCADGDIHKIAKAKRLAKAQEVHRAVLAGEHRREPSKIKGRGFDRTFRKTMSGKVVPR